MDMYSRISEVSINQIMVFLKCVELENYSKAAEALNYTPSMVSKTVKKLEEKLGLVLFIRRGAHVKPTNAAYQLQREWDAVCAAEREAAVAHEVEAGPVEVCHGVHHEGGGVGEHARPVALEFRERLDLCRNERAVDRGFPRATFGLCHGSSFMGVVRIL
jgi:DNA-binding transcriptional LysR family regulator